MNQDTYSKFLQKLKIKYGDAYLALANAEERETFAKYFALAFNISIDASREKLKTFITFQNNNLYYKPYIDYVKNLEEKYGRYYFSKINSDEREKLLKKYVKYMRLKTKKYSVDDAFNELYLAERQKYEKDRLEVSDAIQRIDQMVTIKQIDISELGLEKNTK